MLGEAVGWGGGERQVDRGNFAVVMVVVRRKKVLKKVNGIIYKPNSYGVGNNRRR